MLRPVAEADLPSIERWYAEAASAVHGAGYEVGEQNLPYQIEEARGSGSGDLLVIEDAGEPGPIGLVDYRRDWPARGWLAVVFIALAKSYRGWGYGSEAVILLESEAEGAWGVRRFRAEVEVRNGLGLYFWLRLGYRPAAAATDERRREVVSMVRDIIE